MLYKIATDVTILFHLMWIGFLVFGALLAYNRPWLRALHLVGLAFSLTMQFYSWYCPLTSVEQWLRSQQGSDLTYTGSFIAQYAERLVYLTVSPSLVLALTLVICGGTITLYLAPRWLVIVKSPPHAATVHGRQKASTMCICVEAQSDDTLLRT